ncbi:MAG: hypothetical protein MI922_19245 [Bacteroidales bacterium]|nr:hypothetical protein [Bacteroidales bacterium]
MRKSILVATSVAILSIAQLSAQTETNSEVNKLRKNSIELNVIWPFVPKIYQVKYGREFFQFNNGMKSEFIASINYRPWVKSDHEGDKTMFSLAAGYRHFWWKGINSELSIYPEFVKIKNNVVDGKNYSDFYVVPEFYTGYKGNIGKKGLFYNIQVGTGKVIFINGTYPRSEESDFFINGNLTVGYSF